MQTEPRRVQRRREHRSLQIRRDFWIPKIGGFLPSVRAVSVAAGMRRRANRSWGSARWSSTMFTDRLSTASETPIWLATASKASARPWRSARAAWRATRSRRRSEELRRSERREKTADRRAKERTAATRRTPAAGESATGGSPRSPDGSRRSAETPASSCVVSPQGGYLPAVFWSS